jgi:GNAT superfamily N-acetyltransferase
MIIPAEVKDSTELMNICIRAFDEDKKLYGAIPPNMEKVMWHRQNIKSGFYYKIIENGSIVGGIKLFNLGKGHMRLGAIYIDPDYQNRHIGSTALEFIERKFPDTKKWSLDTPYKSYRNHYFYEKLGYTKIAEEHPEKDKEFVLFIYEKICDINHSNKK